MADSPGFQAQGREAAGTVPPTTAEPRRARLMSLLWHIEEYKNLLRSFNPDFSGGLG